MSTIQWRNGEEKGQSCDYVYIYRSMESVADVGSKCSE